MRAIEKIEKFFNMSFEKIISDLHWKDGLSIFELSSRCGFSRDCFQKEAKRLNLKLMNRHESALRKYEHHKHWAIGLTKENSRFGKMHSLRMKKNNPSFNEETRNKMSKSLANKFKENLLPQEILFKDILDRHCNLKYEIQYPIKQYIIDFFIPSLNLCIEIDSTDKWGNDRKEKAIEKDNNLKYLGFNILRINKRHLENELYIVDILNSNNIISN